jgi:sugar phosphate isomerase/epimerase
MSGPMDERERAARLARLERRVFHLAAELDWPRVRLRTGGFLGPGREGWREVVLGGWLQEQELAEFFRALKEATAGGR